VAGTFRLRIVTPERELVDEEVEEVTAPGAAGEFGVLPDHIAFLTVLVPGRLIYKSGGRRHVVAIFGGYAEVADNVMTVLADGAERAGDIDVEAARRAMAEAETSLARLDATAPDFEIIRRAIEQQRARIAAAAEPADRI
jgi:F-type H+-transporting ATPase subunit epsilon